MVIKKFNHLESAQKIHASRGQCIVHAHQLVSSHAYCYCSPSKASNYTITVRAGNVLGGSTISFTYAGTQPTSISFHSKTKLIFIML